MRKTVLAVLTAAAVTLGLAVTVGTASAAPQCGANAVDGHRPDGTACHTPAPPIVGDINVGNGVGVGNDNSTTTSAAPSSTPAAANDESTFQRNWAKSHPGQKYDRSFYLNRNHPGAVRGGINWNGRHYNDRFDGRYLVIDGFNQRLDVCGNYTSYNDFAGRYGTYRGRLDVLFGNGSKWDNIRRTNGCGVATNTVVTNNGDCQTLTTYATNYRSAVNGWNRVSRQYHAANAWGPHRGELDRFHGDRVRWFNDYNTLRGRLTASHTVCNAPSITNVTIEAPPVNYTVQAPAPLPSVDPAPAPVVTPPAPVASAPAALPKGAPETGDSGLVVS